MKINNLYESILDEFEAETINIQDVIKEKEIKNEIPLFLNYIKEHKVDLYKNLKENVEKENNSSYAESIGKAVERYKELYTSIAKANNLDVKLEDLNNIHSIELNFEQEAEKDLDFDFDGVTETTKKIDLNKLKSEVEDVIFVYLDELENFNTKNLSNELSITIESDYTNKYASEPVGWDHSNDLVIEKDEFYQNENILISVNFKGENSNNITKEDLKNIKECIEELLPHKLVDNTISFSIQDQKTKNKRKQRSIKH